MNLQDEISRREWLRQLALLAAQCGLLSSGEFVFTDEVNDEGRIADWTAQFLHVAQLGEIYLQLHPLEIERTVLIDKIFPALRRANDAPDSAELSAAFLRRVGDDYAQNRCARIGGWLLSETECRLCALAHLLSLEQRLNGL